MRDHVVIGMQAANARRSALLLAQFEFLETRLAAFEGVWALSGFMDRLRWIWSPRGWIVAVNAVQQDLLAKRREQAAAAQERIEAEGKIVTPRGPC